MRYLSVCSGIEAATVAWHPLGWEAVAYSEVDAFPSAVLAHHYPDVPNYGDMTKFQEWPDAAFDVLVGGTPCQSFSVAGLRAGLDDPRGNLMLVYLALARRTRPRWLVWENVPGVLSSNGGRDFGTFLWGLGQLGYGVSYRVLDAQYFGLAQRRKRVFVVACLGSWQRAAAVLFERASLSGHPAPRREARQVAPTVPARRTGGGGLSSDFDCDGGLIPERARALTASNQRIDWETETFIAHSLRADGFDASEDGTGRGTPMVPELVGTMKACKDSGGWSNSVDHAAAGYMVPVAHAFDARQSDVLQYGNLSGPLDTDGTSIAVAFSAKDYGADAGDLAPTLRAGGHTTSHANGGVMPAVAFNFHKSGNTGSSLGVTEERTDCLRSDAKAPMAVYRPHMAVRRLTPRECERLQGFPDDYTAIPYRGKLAADGPRYKALGNSMAVPCMRWIGERIQMVDDL